MGLDLQLSVKSDGKSIARNLKSIREILKIHKISTDETLEDNEQQINNVIESIYKSTKKASTKEHKSVSELLSTLPSDKQKLLLSLQH